MGNTGSSGAGGASTAATATEKKTCYYELLAVEKSANQDEIKKAYKRKALELHPDRNYNDVERTTKLFAEIQAAYEVLSDPQERAWYDSHREAILHGRDPQTSAGGGGGQQAYTSTTTPDEILSWFTLFPSKAKIDYTDAPAGFYNVLSSTFAKLAEEERTAAAEEGLEEPRFPSFGGSKSGYEDHVRGFYQHWINFKTVKDFAWCDAYRLSDAPDRRIRRAMEKENERLRREGRREYEDTVREFVQFVRKRDPRYVPQAPRTEEERRADNLARSKEQAARARAANAAAQSEYKPADWTRVAPEVEDMYEDAYSEVGEEEESEEEERLECVVCRKIFKTQGQMVAHENSKKHKQAVWQLKKKMQKENKEMGLSAQASDNEDDEEVEEDLDDVQLDEVEDQEEEEKEKVKNEEEEVPVTDEKSKEETPSPKPVAENAAKGGESDNEQGGEDEDEDEEEEDSDYVPISRFHARVFGSSNMPGDDDDDDDDDSALADTLAETSLEAPEPAGKEPPSQQPKLGKAKAKREKKKAAAAAASGTGTPVSEHTCVSCHEQFTSKTKIFAHLKDNPSHAAPPTQVKGKSGGGGGGGGSSGKKGKGKKK